MHCLKQHPHGTAKTGRNGLCFRQIVYFFLFYELFRVYGTSGLHNPNRKRASGQYKNLLCRKKDSMHFGEEKQWADGAPCFDPFNVTLLKGVVCHQNQIASIFKSDL